MNEVEERTAINEVELKALLKQEIARLKDGAITADEIDDEEPLFSIPGECDSRIELDSLDALELAFAVEQATGITQPEDWDYHDLVSVRRIAFHAQRLIAPHGSKR
jgi:acyl carrier protein